MTTYRDRVARLLLQRPGQWIDGRQLATIGGAYAWRTRLSECRRQLDMDIHNRQRKVGDTIVSEYRYLPKTLFDGMLYIRPQRQRQESDE